jgi:hypothetical protein
VELRIENKGRVGAARSPFVVRFFARRAKKRTTDKMISTLLPQAKSGVQ